MTYRCDTCAFAEKHGHYPKGVHAHCDLCHRNWRGLSEAHCVACCRHFGGMSAFDAHQRDGICRDPSDLKTRGGEHRFHMIERLDGVVWVKVRPVDGNQYAATATETDEAPKRRARSAVPCETPKERLVERVA